jgi:hypothetical protein
VVVYAVIDLRTSPDSPVGDAPVDVFVELDDAERFIEEVRSDDPDLARWLWINEREMIDPSRLSS